MQQRGRPGPALPYDLLAGVVPCRKGWLVAPGKLVGISLHPEAAYVAGNFADVVDNIPSYAVIAVAAPIGLHPHWTEHGRRCDVEARHLLGFPRLGAIASPPGRLDLRGSGPVKIDAVSRRYMTRIAELDEEMQPYRQRSVYSVHPELSFYQINSDQPLSYAKESVRGMRERTELVTKRMQGADRILAEEIEGATASQLLDAVAALWTARRIKAKAATRIPMDPEWDDEGLRVEWVR